MRWIPLVLAMLCLWVLPGQSPDQGGTERTCAIWIKLIGTRPVRIQPRARVDTVNLRQLTRRNSEIKGDFYKYRCGEAPRRTSRRRESSVEALVIPCR